MKHIICSGIAKCGTSSLNAFFFHHVDAVSTPQHGKEIQFFSPLNSAEHVLILATRANVVDSSEGEDVDRYYGK
jgi:hypothetical protein